jgi:hypothetical protein
MLKTKFLCQGGISRIVEHISFFETILADPLLGLLFKENYEGVRLSRQLSVSKRGFKSQDPCRKRLQQESYFRSYCTDLLIKSGN